MQTQPSLFCVKIYHKAFFSKTYVVILHKIFLSQMFLMRGYNIRFNEDFMEIFPNYH